MSYTDARYRSEEIAPTAGKIKLITLFSKHFHKGKIYMFMYHTDARYRSEEIAPNETFKLF